jgi:hypothetical protein
VKVLRYGKSDIQTPTEASPHGIDSNPVKDMIAVFSDTEESGKPVIIGYLNKNRVADVGELRLFSTDKDGKEVFYAYLKNDGTMELGGKVDNLLRFIPLDAALQQMAIDLNIELVKISAAISALGGAYGVTPISIDISQAKIDEIKTL